ncbi:hypothetical protein LSH36_838g01142 [Paralvinella palmiformis]|uniref:Uncharacterized protein n=1 Tax=Paralvinella palmiformis TaxID=53620 RepID=A0AAD9IYU6_9ANNE|nr:hypothetical protein LSH36_838g01142 [Paralvinella palmiformis]
MKPLLGHITIPSCGIRIRCLTPSYHHQLDMVVRQRKID